MRKMYDDLDDVKRVAEFYDETDTTELEGEDVTVEVGRRPMVSRSVRFDRDTMRRLRTRADERGIGVTRLMRQWIEERLADEEAAHEAHPT